VGLHVPRRRVTATRPGAELDSPIKRDIMIRREVI